MLNFKFHDKMNNIKNNSYTVYNRQFCYRHRITLNFLLNPQLHFFSEDKNINLSSDKFKVNYKRLSIFFYLDILV